MRNLIKGLKTLLSYESRELYKISRLPRRTNFKTKIAGFLLEGNDPPSFIAQYKDLILREIYKFNLSNTNTPYIIDCGVNIGLSVISLKRMYPEAKIIGFEPDPNIFLLAQKNIKNAGCTNVEIIKEAVWIKETTMIFHQEGSAGGRLTENENDKTVKVSTFDLKKLITREVDFLKIDIEGAEYDIIKDIDNSLHFVKNIFIEFHSKLNQEQNLGEIINILKKNNFRYYLESGSRNPKNPLVSRNEIDGFDNLINIFGYQSQI